MDPSQEIVRHGIGHALGELTVIVLIPILLILLGLDQFGPRLLTWVRMRLWARAIAIVLVLAIILLLIAIGFDFLPANLLFLEDASNWVLHDVDVSLPRWLLSLVFLLSVLKCWDWRWVAWRWSVCAVQWILWAYHFLVSHCAQERTEPSLKIIVAKYGAKGKFNDVKKLLTDKIVEGKLELPVENDNLGGDPIYLTEKQLTVDYQYSGLKHSKTVDEHKTLVLP